MPDNTFVYDAFISYRHKPLDMAVAKAIHKQLETYRIPAGIQKKTGKKRMGKVFRDQEELPLLADLGEGIRRALEQSEWLIVICSPELLESKWCMKEIDTFIALGRRDRILTVLVSGEPQDSFPVQLRVIDGDEREPLAADVRAASPARTLARVRREKLRLLAPMLGVGYDDLRRRQRERAVRTAVLAGAVAFAAMAGATGYVLRQNSLLAEQIVFAEEQRQLAEEQTAIAEEQRQAAIINAEWAMQEKALAEEQRQLADEQRMLAEEQKQIAVTNEEWAVQEKAYAEEQRAFAEEQEQIAVEQQKIAEAQTIIADEQRLIAEVNERWANDEKNDALISQSKFLSGISMEQMAKGDPMTAAMLALEALPSDVSNPDRPLVPEAITALRVAGFNQRMAGFTLASGIASSYESKFEYFEKYDILCIVRSETVDLYRGLTGQLLHTFPAGAAPRVYKYNEATGKMIASFTRGGVRVAWFFDLVTLESREFPLKQVEYSSYSLDITPDGTRLVVSHINNTSTNYLSVYDTATGAMLWHKEYDTLYADITLPEPRTYDPGISSISISPDGERIAYSLSFAYALKLEVVPVRVLDLETGQKIAEYGKPVTTTYKPCWFPSGDRILLITNKGVLEAWSPGAKQPLAVYGAEYDNPNGFCRDFMFSPDGLYLVVRTYDEKIKIYDTRTLREAIAPQSDWKFAQIGFAGGHTLVFRDSQRTVLLIYEIGDTTVQYLTIPGGLYWAGSLISTYSLYDPVFHAAGNTIVTFSEKGMYHIWRRDGGQGFVSLDEEDYYYLSYSRDGTLCMLANDTHVTIRDAVSGERLHTLDFAGYNSAEWSPDGSQLLLASYDAHVALFDTATGKKIAGIPSKYTSSPFELKLSVSGDWKYLVLNNPGHTDGLYRLPSLELVSNFDHLREDDTTYMGYIQFTTSAVFRPDGKTFCIPYRSTLRVIDAETLEQVGQYDYNAVGERLYPSPDRTKIAFFITVEGSGTNVAVIDARTGRLLWRREAHNHVYDKPVVWSADGRRFVTNHANIAEAKVWDVATGALLNIFALERPSLSPDGTYLSGEVASTGYTSAGNLGGGVGEIYEVDTGALYMRLPSPGLYSPSAERVLMVDGIWTPGSLPAAMEAAKARLQGRTLTETERKMYFLD